jgi:hypothetical protein
MEWRRRFCDLIENVPVGKNSRKTPEKKNELDTGRKGKRGRRLAQRPSQLYSLCPLAVKAIMTS